MGIGPDDTLIRCTSNLQVYLVNHCAYSVKAVLDTNAQDIIGVKREEMWRLLETYNDDVEWKIYKNEDEKSITIAQIKE